MNSVIRRTCVVKRTSLRLSNLTQPRFAWALFVLLTYVFSGALQAEIGDSSPAKITLDDLIYSEGLSMPILSPDGRWFALARQGQIVVVPSEGGWPVVLTTNSGAKSELRWSPDGKSIVFISEGAI